MNVIVPAAHAALVSEFMAAVRGVPVHHVTKAMDALTPGHLWAGSSKSAMARKYADSNVRNGYGFGSYRCLIGLDLSRLARIAKARQAGDPLWRSVK